MNKFDALKFVDNSKIADQLSELYGGDWQVSSDFDEKTGEIKITETLGGTVKTTHLTLKFPSSAWNDAKVFKSTPQPSVRRPTFSCGDCF